MPITLGDLEYDMLYQHKDDYGTISRIFRPSPFICHFCGEPIVVMKGRTSEALAVHSLDEDHDNWEPSNKVSAHRGCHATLHNKGDRNPMYGNTEIAKKGWDTRRKRYPPFGKPSGYVPPMLGKKHTEKTKRLMRESHLGKHLTDETKRKIGIGNKASWERRKH